MKYNNLTKIFQDFSVISLNSLRLVEPNLSLSHLSKWKKAKKIISLAKNRYLIPRKFQEFDLCKIANHLYKPSYLSLEYALSYYEIIPEGVFALTSVSTLKTQRFQTEIGTFIYRHLKPSLFFGYYIVQIGDNTFLMADLEKCLLDFLYLNPQYTNLDDFEGLRLNQSELKEKLNLTKLENYQKQFNSQTLNKKIAILIEYINKKHDF